MLILSNSTVYMFNCMNNIYDVVVNVGRRIVFYLCYIRIEINWVFKKLEGITMKISRVIVVFIVLLVYFIIRTNNVLAFWGNSKTEKTVQSYEESGKEWGSRLIQQKLSPGATNDELVSKLVSQEELDYFNIHSELKDAFKKGFRIGYGDRTADLVLGPHITKSAGVIGGITAQNFKNVIETFEGGWAATLNNAIKVFIVLISEGSQSDRDEFIADFMAKYKKKYDDTESKLKSGGYMSFTSEGGTRLFVDIRKTHAVLDIPAPKDLKTEIYHQTFRAMGDEWGKRYSTNLIKRDDLVELLRKCKPVLEEVSGNNLGMIYDNFHKAYGKDADEIFMGLIKEAGYKETPIASQQPILTDNSANNSKAKSKRR